ncbi:hypothetical protein KKA01_02520, partial [Patescibacteria group bacterium]|nr:hypothetical protein [Patescibacteria group bacterium]
MSTVSRNKKGGEERLGNLSSPLVGRYYSAVLFAFLTARLSWMFLSRDFATSLPKKIAVIP